ncbi:MAG: hypothetical protein ABJQ85_12105 [Rhizobiaceae bacterium]
MAMAQPIAEDFQARCSISDANGKFEFGGGRINGANADGAMGQLAGSIALPLNCQVGLQLDGVLAKTDELDQKSLSTRVFTRVPSAYMLGFYGEVGDFGNTKNTRLGFEGESYFERLTVSAVGGWENNDTSDTGAFGAIKLSFYATDDFKIDMGVVHAFDSSFGLIGAEWQPNVFNASLFAQLKFGEDDFSSVTFGLRLPFGADRKSLLRRHREDGLENWSAILATMNQMKQETPVENEEDDVDDGNGNGDGDDGGDPGSMDDCPPRSFFEDGVCVPIDA